MSPVETDLHSLFKPFNITDLDSRKDGYTEWFDYSCFSRVKDMIEMFSKENKIQEVKIEEQEVVSGKKKARRIPRIHEDFERVRVKNRSILNLQQMISIGVIIEQNIKKLDEPRVDALFQNETYPYYLNNNKMMSDVAELNLPGSNDELKVIVSELIRHVYRNGLRVYGSLGSEGPIENYYFSARYVEKGYGIDRFETCNV